MKSIPDVLTLSELAALLKVSKRELFDFRRAHNHPAVDELPGPGQPRFRGAAVRTWLAGGPRAVTRRPPQPGTSLQSQQRRVG
jgi:hypothetical protein